MSKAFNQRYDQADQLTNQMVKLAFAASKRSLGEENANYAIGYISSVLRMVAAQSKDSVQELQSMVDWESTKQALK